MKALMGLILGMVLCGNAIAQDTIFSIGWGYLPRSNFEDRDTSNYFYFDSTQINIWQIGKPMKTVFDSARSAPLALLTDTLNTYPVNNQSSYEFVIFGDAVTEIVFWHRFELDSLYDGGKIDVSSDGGVTWTNVVSDTVNDLVLNNFYATTDTIKALNNEPGFTGTQGWTQSIITRRYGMNFLRFRFTFASDSIDNSKDGWLIDDFGFLWTVLGIEKTNPSAVIHIYPNPFTEGFTVAVHSNGETIELVRVYSIHGSLISTSEPNDKRAEVSLAGVLAGIYLVEVWTSGGHVLRRKVIARK